MFTTQICKKENSAEVYIILEDIKSSSNDTVINVVSLTDLQRNISNPLSAPKQSFKISELTVVADSLTLYVESWNK